LGISDGTTASRNANRNTDLKKNNNQKNERGSMQEEY
jgi:hypothetical protein